MKFNLRPQNIIVIGGGSGIGYATAQMLLDNGICNLILASRSKDKLEMAKGKLKCSSMQNVYTFDFDIANVQRHDEYLKNMQLLIGKENALDGIVISSGINFDGSNWKGFNISEADWDKVMDTNLKGVFFLIRAFSNRLFSHGTKGNICVVSSISAHRDLLSIYQITKNAISRIVHTYGKYLCERGIVLNCVEPGVTDTPMMPHLKDYTDGVREGNPFTSASIQRVIRPEEIAEIIGFLMSDLGEVMSGSCILAGGGNKGLFP